LLNNTFTCVVYFIKLVIIHTCSTFDHENVQYFGSAVLVVAIIMCWTEGSIKADINTHIDVTYTKHTPEPH